MKAHDLRTTFSGPADWATPDGAARYWQPLRFNDGHLWVGRFGGRSAWERHPDSDELLHVLEGELTLTVLADDGPRDTLLRSGSVFVVPRGLWHRHTAPSLVTEYGVTMGRTESSEAEDPRTSG